MADHGEAALRLLDPRWTTVRATVRQWTDPGRMAGFLGRAERSRPQGPSVVAGAAPGSGPQATEEFVRLWRSGRSLERLEHASSPAAPSSFSVFDDGDIRVLVHGDGNGRRIPRATNYGYVHPNAWMGDPDLLLGMLNVRFTAERRWMGRTVDDATTEPALSARQATGRFGPMLGGIVIGTAGALTVDRATGLVVRYEACDEEGRPFYVAEFLDLVIDEPIPVEHFRYTAPPGRTVRGAFQDALDHVAAEGVDVSGIDPDDPDAHNLLEERRHGRGLRGPAQGQMPPPVTPRPLAEVVAPLGPPPADVDAARSAIAEALAGWGNDNDRPAAECIERGELVDAQPPPPPHPMVGDQTVSYALRDLAFIRDDEALIEFEIRLSGGMGPIPFKGRAVLRGDRWLVSYDTWATLQQMGGVPVPSLLEQPEDPEEGP